MTKFLGVCAFTNDKNCNYKPFKSLITQNHLFYGKNTGKKFARQGKLREFYLGWNVATLRNVDCLFWWEPDMRKAWQIHVHVMQPHGCLHCYGDLCLHALVESASRWKLASLLLGERNRCQGVIILWRLQNGCQMNKYNMLRMPWSQRHALEYSRGMAYY